MWDGGGGCGGVGQGAEVRPGEPYNEGGSSSRWHSVSRRTHALQRGFWASHLILRERHCWQAVLPRMRRPEGSGMGSGRWEAGAIAGRAARWACCSPLLLPLGGEGVAPCRPLLLPLGVAPCPRSRSRRGEAGL
jgi:hypothetical protein